MIKNFYDEKGELKKIHEGKGLIHSVKLFGVEDFDTDIGYVAFTAINPGDSIGYHEHVSDREEIYVILEGNGIYTENTVASNVKPGDVIVAPVGAMHSLENTGDITMNVFVCWVAK